MARPIQRALARPVADLKIYDVPTHLLPDVWPLAKPLLEKAMERHPFLDTDELLEILLVGRGQLMVLATSRIIAAIVMQRIAYPRKFAALILAMGAEKNSWYRRYLSETQAHIEAWARGRGCAILHTFGRPGWRHMALRCGGRVETISLSWKELE